MMMIIIIINQKKSAAYLIDNLGNIHFSHGCRIKTLSVVVLWLKPRQI